MNPNSFSILGYLSVLLWLAVPVVWFLRRRFTLPCWVALSIAVAAFLLATLNSRLHVNRIEVKQAEQTVNQLDIAASKRKAVEEARGGEVADIRFAEDSDDDFIDEAGMEDADKKYLDSINESGDPAWKGKKKERGETEEEGGDLDDELGGKEAISGVKSDSLPTEEKRPPIFMSDAHMAIANRLDNLNRNASQLAVLLGMLILVVDYLARANSYSRDFFPLPLPASWRNAFSPMPALVRRPNPARRSIEQELAWLVRRGDVFIYFTKDATLLPTTLPRLGKFGKPIDLLHVDSDRISDEFIFESLWYGRCCFVVDSMERISQLIRSINVHMEQRHAARACAKQTVHVICNIDQELPDQDIAAFETHARHIGFSLFIFADTNS